MEFLFRFGIFRFESLRSTAHCSRRLLANTPGNGLRRFNTLFGYCLDNFQSAIGNIRLN